jgi:hypothetical protein
MVVAAMLFISATLLAISVAGQMRGFDISPNPMDDYTVISLEFEQALSASVSIEDRYGNVVCNLYNGIVDKSIQLPWERVDNFGNYVPSGKYWVVVSYASRFTSTKKTLILK